jgi:hypothetical protein
MRSAATQQETTIRNAAIFQLPGDEQRSLKRRRAVVESTQLVPRLDQRNVFRIQPGNSW